MTFASSHEVAKSRGYTPPIPSTEHEYRLNLTKRILRKNDMDAVLFFGSAGTADPIRYLAEYVHIIPRSHSFLLVPATGEPTLLIDRPWHLEDAKYMSRISDIRTFPRGSMQLSYTEIKSTLSKLLADADIKEEKIGIFEKSMPTIYQRALNDIAPAADFMAGDPVWHELVTSPSDYGKDMMARAVDIADEGLKTAIATCQHGVSEREVCLSAMKRMASLGADFVLAGPSTKAMIGSHSEVTSNLKPFVFTGNRLQNGQMFWYDQITAYNGYYIDCDRTICVGEPSDKQREVYETVRRMYDAMLETLEPGVSASKLWYVGYEIAANAGYEDYVNFIHHGHTIGPTIAGQSAAAPDIDTTITADSFINIEPGLFVPEVGSACIENTIYVKENSNEPINDTEIGIHVV